MKKRSDIPNQQIIFTFDGLEPVTLQLAKVSDDVLEHAQYHGFEARIGDAAALSRKQPDGTVIQITEAMRRAAVEELVNHYHSGTKDWELRTRKAAAQNPTILAIAAKMGVTYAEAEAEIQRRMLAEIEGS